MLCRESLLQLKLVNLLIFDMEYNYGQHNKETKSYGHSMVVDPWGDIIG